MQDAPVGGPAEVPETAALLQANATSTEKGQPHPTGGPGAGKKKKKGKK